VKSKKKVFSKRNRKKRGEEKRQKKEKEKERKEREKLALFLVTSCQMDLKKNNPA
jgi:hypothetical protein